MHYIQCAITLLRVRDATCNYKVSDMLFLINYNIVHLYCDCGCHVDQYCNATVYAEDYCDSGAMMWF